MVQYYDRRSRNSRVALSRQPHVAEPLGRGGAGQRDSARAYRFSTRSAEQTDPDCAPAAELLYWYRPTDRAGTDCAPRRTRPPPPAPSRRTRCASASRRSARKRKTAPKVGAVSSGAVSSGAVSSAPAGSRTGTNREGSFRPSGARRRPRFPVQGSPPQPAAPSAFRWSSSSCRVDFCCFIRASPPRTDIPPGEKTKEQQRRPRASATPKARREVRHAPGRWRPTGGALCESKPPGAGFSGRSPLAPPPPRAAFLPTTSPARGGGARPPPPAGAAGGGLGGERAAPPGGGRGGTAAPPASPA
eukprot:1192968-Prorocentrum_minimum.AAC.3